ncbi:MAG TPA: hypothetical protein VFV05_17990 [Methylomirabilota bacterium]|nr:hypothetical protein [Methylomirabilota bacterium]
MAAGSFRRFPVAGGIAAWQIPLVATALGLGALGLGLVELAVAVGVLGSVAQSLLRGVVVEISPRGLTRGFLLNGRFLGRTTVMAWEAVASVHTDWRRAGDDTALATTVRDGHGRAIHFTTAMGLRGYWACVTSVAARVPAARQSGLTEALVAGEPPGRRSILSAAATAGTLALILVTLVGIHYLWAQGPSSLARYLEQTGAAR